jgi:hypothetical protein
MLSVSPKSRPLSWFLRASQAEREERSGLPRFFFGYFYVLFIIIFLPHRMPNVIMGKFNV